MKGLTSKDGKMSGNVQTVGSYDRSKGHKPQAGRPDHTSDDGGGAESTPMHEVVAKHGAAKQHLVTKGPDGGFESHTMHESGHKHGPVHHDSLDEAHEHGRQAMEDTEHNENNMDSQRLAEGRDESEDLGGAGSHKLSFMD
jgi:hypothetical protein